MKTIAVYNNKGGIGKTVTSVNLAYELTVRGYRVLLIDTDPQGNASSFYRRYDLTKASVTELLMGARPTRCKWRTRFKNLDIVSANSNLRTVDPGKLVAGVGTLRLALWVYENDYDYCIIDCPPGVGFLIEVVMDAVEDVIIPLNKVMDAYFRDEYEKIKMNDEEKVLCKDCYEMLQSWMYEQEKWLEKPM